MTRATARLLLVAAILLLPATVGVPAAVHVPLTGHGPLVAWPAAITTRAPARTAAITTRAPARTAALTAPTRAPARTADVTARLTVSSVQPAVAPAGTPVRIGVTVVNTGDQPLADGQVVAVLDGRRLASRADVAGWAAARELSGVATEVARVPTPRLDPGQAGLVRLTVPSASLRSAAASAPFAALPLAVELRSGGGAVRLAQAHSFLAYSRVKEYQPLSIAFAVPLTLDPAPALFGPPSAARNAAWTAAVGPASRLQRLVEATTGEPVTWAVDPAVLGPAPAARFPASTPTVTPTVTAAATPTGTPAGTPTGTRPASPAASPATTSPASPATISPPAPGPTPSTPGTVGTPSSPGTATSSPPAPAPTPSTPSTPSTPGGDEVPQLSADLLERLRADAARHTVWQLPYADPDLTALLAAAPGNPLLRDLLGRATDLAGLLGATVTGGAVAWPVGGPVTAAREATLRHVYTGSGLTAAVTWVSQLPSQSGFTGGAARKTADGLPLLAADDALSGQFARAGTPAQVSAATQRFLADSLALLAERPGTPRPVLVTAPRSFAAEPASLHAFFAAIRSAAWLRPVDTQQVLAQAVTARPERVPGTPVRTTIPAATVRASPLTPNRLGAIPRTLHQVEGIADMLAQDGPRTAFRTGWTDAQQQLLSTRWRGQATAFAALDRATQAAVAALAGGIHVEPRTINFFADQGLIQITVVNALSVEVRDVQVHLTVPGAEANRLRIEGQPAPLRIGARSRASVRQAVTATASGRVRIVATLRTANGTPLGAPAAVDLRVRPTATWIFWVLGVGAGVVMVIGVVRSLRSGRRAPLPYPATVPEQEGPP
ncbi:MAG TPA: DUF6049 family protein [Dermatophilaceae bacterium]|nr:DUF6049 family protein [Dermatophilaceae bacterium]